jgi:hypothetical protein
MIATQITLCGCGFGSREAATPEAMKPFWKDEYLPLNESIPWPKGLSYSQLAALEDPERVYLATLDRTGTAKKEDEFFHGDRPLTVWSFTGEDAKAICNAIVANTRDVPIRADEWYGDFGVRVISRLETGNEFVVDLMVAPKPRVMLAYTEKECRICYIDKSTDAALRRFVAP